MNALSTIEIWTRWEPTQGLAAKYYIEEVILDVSNFRVILSECYDTNRKMIIVFPNAIYAHQGASVEFFSQKLNILSERYGKEFYTTWTFFKITNSEFVGWVAGETIVHEDAIRSSTHFCILGANYILDILDSSDPIIEFIEDK